MLIGIIIGIKRSIEPTVASQNNVNLTKMSLKLIFAFGVAEVIGVIQISGTNEEAVLVGQVITILHSVLRSCRGILLFFTFFLTKNVLKHVKNKIRGVTESTETHSSKTNCE